MTMIDFDNLDTKAEELAVLFREAKPFNYVAIDGFLSKQGLERIRALKLHENASSSEKSSDLVFAKNKIENPAIEKIAEPLSVLRDEMLSDRFQRLLSHVVGFEVFVDPTFTGGGLHQGGEGSFLEMHADFTRHPVKREWIRELNILLYLNPDYCPEWGGCLDLRHRDTGEEHAIPPIENRAVIMLTKGHTLHGYRPIRFPPGRYRTSIAAYAYTLDDGSRDVAYASTTWVPQSSLKRALAGVMNPLVALKQRWFGSRTADRARR